MNQRLLLWLGAVLLLTSCQVAQADPPDLIPSSTVPAGVEADALYIDEEAERLSQQIHATTPGGISMGIRGTYEELVPGQYTTFYVKQRKPFVGEFFLRSGKLEAHSYIVLCLLDHLQIPCSPGAASAQLAQGITGGDVIRIPLQIPLPGKGLHDLIVVFQEDPYLLGSIGSSAQDRTGRDLKQMRASLSIDGSVTAPNLSYEEPVGRPGFESISHGFVVSDLEDPRGDQGGWIIWTKTTAKAGELLDLFLHFDGDEDREYAVLAFIDFEQIPVYVGSEPRLPLYIRTRVSTWHPLPVQIRAPAQPGQYELRLLVIEEPFTRMDFLSTGEDFSFTVPPHSSPRVLLQVE